MKQRTDLNDCNDVDMRKWFDLATHVLKNNYVKIYINNLLNFIWRQVSTNFTENKIKWNNWLRKKNREGDQVCGRELRVEQEFWSYEPQSWPLHLVSNRWARVITPGVIGCLRRFCGQNTRRAGSQPLKKKKRRPLQTTVLEYCRLSQLDLYGLRLKRELETDTLCSYTMIECKGLFFNTVILQIFGVV